MKKIFVVLGVLVTVTLSACRATPEGEKAGNAFVEAETKPESEALAEAEAANIPENFQFMPENEDGRLNIDAAVIKGETPVTKGTVEVREYTLDEIQAVFAPDEEFEKSEEMGNDYSDVWVSDAVTSSDGVEWNKMISIINDTYLLGASVSYLDSAIDRKNSLIMEPAPLPKAQKAVAKKRQRSIYKR